MTKYDQITRVHTAVPRLPFARQEELDAMKQLVALDASVRHESVDV